MQFDMCISMRLNRGLGLNTYYLYQEVENGRWIIDTEFPKNAYRVFDKCKQDCWISAKKWFGYELSEIQKYLLERFRNKKAQKQ